MTRRVGLGILLPVERGETGYFRQGFDVLTQTKANLINLVLTKKGERLFQPSFGCDIHGILFEKITATTMADVRSSIIQATQIWLPHVSIDEVEVVKNEDKHEVYVKIDFSLTTNRNISDTITLVL